MANEIQITNAPHGHILTNTAVWSPDSQWIVYDVRSDPAGSVFDGTRIERVHVATKRIEVLYKSKNGACVGMATVHPHDGRVVFIQGPEFPTPDWSYSACHREGLTLDPEKPDVAYALEARDVVPPFTAFALRGGTHVPTWSSAGVGAYVAFTYEDHVLTHGKTANKEPNRRTVGVAQWLPEPIVDSDLSLRLERDETLSVAMLRMLERLAPNERVVFVLREAFDLEYGEIATIMRAAVPTCRQWYRRALFPRYQAPAW